MMRFAFCSFLIASFTEICLVSSQTVAAENDLWETYTKCRDKLGRPNWLCDPYDKIYRQTADEINDLLWRLQTEVPCYCTFSNDCYRYGANMQIQSGVVGAMIVTTYLPDDFVQTAKRIYNDAQLASQNCSNGMLIVYAMEGKNLYTYRGELTEKTLDTSDAVKIMNQTMKDLESRDYRYALPELVRQYISYLKGQTYDRQRTWESMVGMVVAVVICAFVAAAALAIFVTSFCCKKRKTAVDYMKSASIKSEKNMGTTKAELVKQMKAKRKNLLTTRSGHRISPKRLLKAHNRVTAKNQANGKASLLHPSSNEEPYYVISEPSTMYSTLPRDSPNDLQRNPYSRPYPITSSTPAVTYPESTISQAYLEPSISPLPEVEVQRRDLFVTDEDEKKIETKPKV